MNALDAWWGRTFGYTCDYCGIKSKAVRRMLDVGLSEIARDPIHVLICKTCASGRVMREL